MTRKPAGSRWVCSASADDAPGQVQRLQQRREPDDLVGLAVHPDLAEHNTTALIEGGQQLQSWHLSGHGVDNILVGPGGHTDWQPD